MRFLLFAIACIFVLGIADMFFVKGRYRHEIWRDVEIEAQKMNLEVGRAVRF
jgi:hypothetical protein